MTKITTNSLQQKIEKRARYKLEKDITALRTQLYTSVGELPRMMDILDSNWKASNEAVGAGVKNTLMDIFDYESSPARVYLYRTQLPLYIERETEEFIASIDKLKDQVEDLEYYARENRN